MRILWLSHFVPYPPRGGSHQRSYNLLRQAAARHEVHLLALNRRTLLGTAAAVDNALGQLRQIAATATAFDLPADRTEVHHWWALSRAVLRGVPFDVSWFQSAAFGRAIQRQASRGFDLVHVDTIGLWPYTGLLERIPVVLNHHNVESHMMTRRAAKEAHRVKRMVYAREAAKFVSLERRACPAASVNLVVSDLDGDRLSEVVGRADIAVVPNGVDVEYFTPNPAAAPRAGSLLFVGGMTWYPNRAAVLYLLHEIWPELTRDSPDRTLTLVGREPPPEVKLAARDSRVRAPGLVDDVRPYFDEAQIYVCPIQDGGGTRLKVLDALAMEKPLVATALAVEGLGLRDGEHYLRAETPSEFVARIRTLETDAGLRRSIAATGRRFVVEQYAWPVIGRTLNDAYARAVNGRLSAPV